MLQEERRILIYGPIKVSHNKHLREIIIRKERFSSGEVCLEASEQTEPSGKTKSFLGVLKSITSEAFGRKMF
jgi:hypothetical protein